MEPGRGCATFLVRPQWVVAARLPSNLQSSGFGWGLGPWEKSPKKTAQKRQKWVPGACVGRCARSRCRCWWKNTIGQCLGPLSALLRPLCPQNAVHCAQNRSIWAPRASGAPKQKYAPYLELDGRKRKSEDTFPTCKPSLQTLSLSLSLGRVRPSLMQRPACTNTRTQVIEYRLEHISPRGKPIPRQWASGLCRSVSFLRVLATTYAFAFLIPHPDCSAERGCLSPPG